MRRNRIVPICVVACVALAIACTQTPPLADTPENRGMINKVSYLLRVEEA